MSGDAAGTTMALPLRTERLVLRRWRPGDREPFGALNADPEVVEYLPGPLTRGDSDDLVERIEAGFDRDGFGLCAVEVAGTGRLAGFAGLDVPRFQAAFTPCVEVGWRLAREYWGCGYATEAAGAVLDVAFGPLALPEVVAFTAAGNRRSRAVMERLGMGHDPRDDFDHPALPPSSPLRRHVLYRVGSDGWRHVNRPAPGRRG